MHRDPGLFSTEPSGQLRELPEKCDDDLNYINPRYLPFDVIPQSLAEDLPLENQINDDQLSQTRMSLPSEFDRTKMGIPDPVPLSLEHPLEAAMNPVMEKVTSTFKSLVHNQTCTHNQVCEGISNLDTLRNFFNSRLMVPPPSIDEGANQDKEQYMCWICEEKKRAPFGPFGTFKRHLNTHRIADVEWHCQISNCTRVFFRRDRIREHFTSVHGILNPPLADVATKVACPFPPICPLCPEIVGSWDDYFRHIKEHCVIRSGSGSSSINGDRPGPGGNGGGNGGESHSPSSAGSSNANKQSQSYTGNQASNQPSYHAGATGHPSSSFGAFMNSSNVRAPTISHSASDNQHNLGHGQRVNGVLDKPFMDDKSHDHGGPRAHYPAEASRQLRPPQPSEKPRSSKGDQSAQKRKRPRKQNEPNEHKELNSRRCKRCNHDLASCHECNGITESVRGCHKCGDPSRSANQAGASSGMPVRTRQVPYSTVRNLSPEYPEALGSFGLPQNMPTQPSYYPSSEFMWQFGRQTRPQSFDDMTSTFEDGLPSGSHIVGMARVFERHEPLNGLKASVPGCDTMLLRSIGLGPIKGQIKQSKPQELGDFTQGAHENPLLQYERIPNLLTAPKPSQCQCSCVTMPVVKNKTHGRLQLSPNEWVEMRFKMSPERESSHPLRTRVQVFVKLLKIRASVAQSSSKQEQRTRPIASGIQFKEDIESDTDSEQDISPTSTSGSELTPMLYWTEEAHDWSFSFDLTWAVLKLAQWTSDTDADTCQQLLLADPGHILDLISMYIMYRFKILWCFAERDWLNLLLRF